MTISLPSTVNDESRIQNLFPLCILLARQVYSPTVLEVLYGFCSFFWLIFFIRVFFYISHQFMLLQDSSVYHFTRQCILTTCTGNDRMNQHVANFILPEINKLSAKVKTGSLSILFVSCGMHFIIVFLYFLSMDISFACFHAMVCPCS